MKTKAGANLPRSAVAPNKIIGVRAANIDLWVAKNFRPVYDCVRQFGYLLINSKDD